MAVRVYTKCMVCDEALVQENELKEYKCDVCGKDYVSNYSCRNGHHICSTCAVKPFFDSAKEICMKSKSKNPVEIAEIIMNSPSFTMIGCKHYIIVPLALYTAYKNCGAKISDFENSLERIKENSMFGQVSMCKVGGFCGIPLAIGRGMYSASKNVVSVEKNSETSNKIAADCMRGVLNTEYTGSPSCCKRNVYVSLLAGTKFIRDNLWIDLELPEIVKCKYSEGNPRCNKELCALYSGKCLIKYM